MSKQIDNIKKLLNNLPKKDKIIGLSLLASRKFEDLYDLVDSAIIKISKGRANNNLKAEYADINIESLENLKSEIEYYMDLAGIPVNNDYYEDLGDEEYNDEEMY